jgi:hypothetical protein
LGVPDKGGVFDATVKACGDRGLGWLLACEEIGKVQNFLLLCQGERSHFRQNCLLDGHGLLVGSPSGSIIGNARMGVIGLCRG